MTLTPKNKYINEAVETIYQLTQEEKIRMQCEAREDYYRTQLGWQDMLKKKDTLLEEKDTLLGEKDNIIQAQESTILNQKAAYESLFAWAKEHGFEA